MPVFPLARLITPLPPPELEAEDILSSSLSTLFTDDTQTQHGDPGGTVIYHSTVFGDLKVSLSNPDGESDRKLFAHYVWSSGILLSELLSDALRPASQANEPDRTQSTADTLATRNWTIKDQTVLELGAGSAIPALCSVRAGASRVVVTDYPTPEFPSLTRRNIVENVPEDRRDKISHQGHIWGDTITSFPVSSHKAFARILAADTLWLGSQHEAQLKSMSWFLSDDEGARVWIVAGFHTGRSMVARFLDLAGSVDFESEWVKEVDTETGEERNWKGEEERWDDEGGRGRWCVVVVLKRSRDERA